MGFQKGNKEALKGTREKLFTSMLRIAVNENHACGEKKLRVIAEKLADCACDGESWAIQQVADRLDGKPAQESTVTIDDKRDATDWTRGDLVTFLHDAGAGSDRAAKANGRGGEPDKVH